MRLCRFALGMEARLGLVVGDRLVDLVAGAALLGDRGPDLNGLGDSMRAFLARGAEAMSAARDLQYLIARMLAEGRPAEADARPVVYAPREVRLLAPISDPEKFLLLGLNYSDHVEETNQPTPTVPVVFAKFRNAIVGPGDAIILPKAAPTRVDYEAELAFVIGRRASRVALEDALDYVAGYCAVNDVTARNVQKSQSQWVMAKTVDTFAPLGPVLVTRDEIPDPQNLSIRCFVNGEQRQNSTTANLIFDVPFLVHHISQTVTLEPGDIISTGTPGGVGYVRRPPSYLQANDTVRVEIENVGVLENPVLMEQ